MVKALLLQGAEARVFQDLAARVTRLGKNSPLGPQALKRVII